MTKTKNCDIEYQDKSFPAYHVFPEAENSDQTGEISGKKHPGLILIHEVWGLTDHIKDVANRFAGEGFSVLAPDLLSETGITEKIDQSIMVAIQDPKTTPEERDELQKKMRAAMAPTQSPEFGTETVEKLKECVSYLLADENVSDSVGVLGFCFGGSYAYQLAAADPRIKLAVPFYGHAPEPLDLLETVSCPIFAFYGGVDERLMNQLPNVEKKMAELGKKFEATVYPGAKHAFFNDSNPTTYNKEAAEDAWKKVLPILHEHLG
ncbi:MAG TPA: dienelactone hydrolase family protein [Candidatus Paceibacterota bacterium]|nr:dienelactone hydrolase family protein [Candidatus Paceibacterota bacterium]